jgi:hypothetical protein
VIYPNAFPGIGADLLIEVKPSGFSSDVLLHSQFADGTAVGLSSDVRAEIYTEFYDPPVPTITQGFAKKETDAAKKSALAVPDMADVSLKFGAMAIGRGRSFTVSDNAFK